MELQLRGINVAYGGVEALHQIDLDLRSGEALAVLGDRGAGKSTLIQLWNGNTRPTAGSITIDGAPYIPKRPGDARRAGIIVIGERPLLALDLSVEDNLLLGHAPAEGGWLDRATRHQLAIEALRPVYGEDLSLDTPVGRLSLAQQRRVEIARSLLAKPRALLIDTLGHSGQAHAMPHQETEIMLELFRTLAAQGLALLYTCRSPEEAKAGSGRTMILRDGIHAQTLPTVQLTPQEAWKTMVPPVEVAFDRGSRAHRPLAGRPVLELRHVAGRTLPKRASLVLREGEIYGLAGLPGSGVPEVLKVIFGIAPLYEGEVRLNGKSLHRQFFSRRFSTAPKPSLGLMSTRCSGGELLIPHGTIADNLMLCRFGDLGEFGCFSQERVELATRDWMEKLRIYGRSPWHLAKELSRSNQRMLALGRLFQEKTRVLLLDDPAHGVAPIVKQRIYQWLYELAGEGRSILLHSANVSELLGLCDTIGVMRHGVLTEARPANKWSEEELLGAATSDGSSSPSALSGTPHPSTTPDQGQDRDQILDQAPPSPVERQSSSTP